MIKEAVEALRKKGNLPDGMTRAVFYEIMEGHAAYGDMKDFLVLLSEKGETVDEIAQAAMVMRDKMKRINLPYDTVLDTCGTGGGMSSFNVSTAVSLIAAGSGVKVAKHGNRSYTSHCGSADVLEALGVKIDIPPEEAARCIEKTGMAFLFAPVYHSAMRHVAGVRKDIKRRTIFNILGPLCNPALANAQIIGVFEKRLTGILAAVLGRLGVKRAFVVHGADGFDEVSVSAESIVSELKDGRIDTYNVRPGDFGIKPSKIKDAACATLKENRAALISVLDGERTPKRDMALANAAVALVAASRARSFKEAVSAAAVSIDSGKAKGVLEALVKFTNPEPRTPNPD